MSESNREDMFETKVIHTTEQYIKRAETAPNHIPVPDSIDMPVRHRRTERFAASYVPQTETDSYHTPVTGNENQAPDTGMPVSSPTVPIPTAGTRQIPTGYTPASYTPAKVPDIAGGTTRFARPEQPTLVPQPDSYDDQTKWTDASFRAPSRSDMAPDPYQNGNSYRNDPAVTIPDSDDDWRSPRWPRIILIVLLILLAGVTAIRFGVPENDDGVLGSVRSRIIRVETAVRKMFSQDNEEAPTVNGVELISTDNNTRQKIRCMVTTNRFSKGVKLIYEDGTDISLSSGIPVNNESETSRTWLCEFPMPEAFTGTIYVSVQGSDGNWNRTDKNLFLSVTDPTPTPVPTTTPVPTETPVPTNVPQGTIVNNVTATPLATATPVFVITPTPVPTEMPTAIPTATPSPEPTEIPTPTPVPTETPVPTPTPMPILKAEAADDSIKITETLFKGAKALTDYGRDEEDLLNAPSPDEYVWADNGVFTFRSDNFRRNAAYGTVEISTGTMSVLWKTPLGSLSTKSNGVVYGVGWGSQPAIVKWPGDVRNLMGLYDTARETSGLREVMFAAQDGKVYFLNLSTGEQTRDCINIGYPLKGSVSVDPDSRPMIGFGQAISKLANDKTGKIGYYVYSLTDNKPLFFINGRESDTQKQYSSNGAFDGTGLFLGKSSGDSLVIAGENGLLYTVKLNTDFDYLDKKKLTVNTEQLYIRTKSADEKENRTGIESSVAMYDKYIYMADGWGLLRCVDSENMQTVWALDCGDNTDAAIALDFDTDGSLGLYTGNTVFDRLKNKKTCTIRRVNALTGEQVWSWDIGCIYHKDELSGCKASPVIGENAIDDLVIFTVNMTGDGKGSTIVALDKKTGKLRWKKELGTTAISSPVAVYNALGNAWIIQADEDGTLHLLDGVTGSEISTLSLDGKIQASPAVYRDILVIGTCSKGNAYMYAIRLE